MNVNLLKLLNKLQDLTNKNNIALHFDKNLKLSRGSLELLLKHLLLELNKLRLNKNVNIITYGNGPAKDINKYIKELSNKGNKLQHLNSMNT